MRSRPATCPTCGGAADVVGEACVSFSDGHAHALSVACPCGWQGVDLRPASCSASEGRLVPALGMTA